MIPFIAPQAFFIVIFVVADVMAALIGQITFGKSHFSGCSRPIFLGPPIMELAPKRMSCLHRFRPGRFFGYFMCRQKISVTIVIIYEGAKGFHDRAISCSMLSLGHRLDQSLAMTCSLFPTRRPLFLHCVSSERYFGSFVASYTI